jgi:NAD+ synthase (glutamine-hydrolysing)
MKIAVAQMDSTIGDFDGNAEKILERLAWAENAGADLVVFPELAICGYPPRDLLEKPSFVRRNLECVERIARATKRVGVVVGYVSQNEGSEGRGLFNSAGILHDGAVRFIQHKALLPEYDVFDEARHFEPSRQHGVYPFAGKSVGLTLCEDLWSLHQFSGRRIYRFDPVELLAGQGAQVILNLSASPFTLGKHELRCRLACTEAQQYGVPVVYCNLVGANDELVFDGRSFVADAAGRVIARAAAFEEDILLLDLDAPPEPLAEQALVEEEEVRRALTLGLSDYMHKCGFDRAIIGLSGGIDSAVVAAIACEAVGSNRVMGVMMPSPFTEQRSIDDAAALAANLGMITCTVPIGQIYERYRATLGYTWPQGEVSLAEENVQARIRGTILMAISNREGALVISTGNKSEMSVGYCTLYGDMVGGFALISDIPKGLVYRLARHLNRERELIPQAIIDRPPSAELRPHQTDQDSLPPYDVLDPIMRFAIEERMDVDAIVAQGFDRAVVERVVQLIDRNEYKRRQAAPGIKITSKAFGLGRRFPIAWKP